MSHKPNSFQIENDFHQFLLFILYFFQGVEHNSINNQCIWLSTPRLESLDNYGPLGHPLCFEVSKISASQSRSSNLSWLNTFNIMVLDTIYWILYWITCRWCYLIAIKQYASSRSVMNSSRNSRKLIKLSKLSPIFNSKIWVMLGWYTLSHMNVLVLLNENPFPFEVSELGYCLRVIKLIEVDDILLTQWGLFDWFEDRKFVLVLELWESSCLLIGLKDATEIVANDWKLFDHYIYIHKLSLNPHNQHNLPAQRWSNQQRRVSCTSCKIFHLVSRS